METAKQTEEINKVEEPIEYLTDRHLMDLGIVGQKELPENLKNCGYEKIFRLISLKQILHILVDKQQKAEIKKTIQKFGFKKSTCAFILERDFTVPLDVQKRMVDYQADLFDDVVITHIRTQPDDLLYCLEHAKIKDKPIAVFTDLDYTSNAIEYAARIALSDKGIYKLKTKAVRFSSNTDKYRIVSRLFSESEKLLHLVLCNKKVRIFQYENFAFEFIGRMYGFRCFSEYFREPSEVRRTNTPKRFILFGFNSADLFYEPAKGLSLRGQELKNVADVDSELRNFGSDLDNGKLWVYLQTRTEFRDILTRLNLPMQ